MATAALKVNHVQHSVLQSKWTLGAADDGVPDQLSRYPNHSVQIAATTLGSFAGATVVIQGSDDGINWFTLHDNTGTNMSATSNQRFDTIAIVPLHIRPHSSGGGVTTSVDVIITSRSFGR